jgi:hypothetical protein
VALPLFGIVSEIFPVFSRKPLFGYRGLVFATFAIAALSVAVWAHHMFATGAVLLPFFSLMTFLIAVPAGIKFFNWIGTMWKGPPPRHNFTELPRIRSERPAFELHYPHMVERMREESHFSLRPGRHRAEADPATEQALASTDREARDDG